MSLRPSQRWFHGFVDLFLADLVREKFAPLLAEHGFVVVEQAADAVTLESSRLRVLAVFDPRGELDVSVALRDSEDWMGWQYTGMVGRASVERLLELALDQMQGDPRILAGDAVFFEHVATERRAKSEAWAAFASGHGPRPSRRRLP
jgi:hypothetical protein